MDDDDPLDPIKSETTLNRSFLKKYTPTWGHNFVRMNRFSDNSQSLWMPMPSKLDSSDEQTLISLMHEED